MLENICADQGRNEGGQRRNNSPRPRITPNHCGGTEKSKVLTMSQVLSSVQCICFQKTSGSNMGEPNLLLSPVAI